MAIRAWDTTNGASYGPYTPTEAARHTGISTAEIRDRTAAGMLAPAEWRWAKGDAPIPVILTDATAGMPAAIREIRDAE